MSKANKKKTNHPFLSNFEDFDSSALGDLENDPSLEAELLELMGGGSNPPPRTERNRKKEINPIEIDNLLKLDLSDDINDGDIDENDPELLAELNGFLNEIAAEELPPQNTISQSQSGLITKLEILKTQYQSAINQATVANDNLKARRYDRSLKSINDMLQRASKGQPVNESEFPPAIHPPSTSDDNIKSNTKPVNLPPTQTNEPPIKSSRQSNPAENKSTNVLVALINRQNEYKHAAIEQRSKNIELAKGLMTVFKQFDEVINAVKSGEPFDLSDLPPPPSEFKLSDLNNDDAEEPVTVPQPTVQMQPFAEELKLRLAFYSDSVVKATAEGNAGKIRRLNRVVQQYNEAIDAFRRHVPFAFEELPTPPGRPPLTVNQCAPAAAAAAAAPVAPVANVAKQAAVKNVSKTSKLLSDRQAAFKAAALKAKQEGDLALAKELLRNAMSIDRMREAADGGLPVDLSQLPSLPNTEAMRVDFSTVDERELPAELRDGNRDNYSREAVLKQLKQALQQQIATANRYASSATLAGDVIGARRFGELATSAEKDLLALHGFDGQGNKTALPQFHYEYRSFAMVQSNSDLGENEMSVEIVGATNLALPQGYSADQFDTYVQLELAFPTDAFQTATGETVKRSNSPQYNSVHKFQVNLKSRVFQRVVKNKPLKVDIFYRKGFLQRDKLYGTSLVKMDRLETSCTIHDSFDIVENRKVVAGKLEVKLRIRSPMNGKENQLLVREKWLVFDHEAGRAGRSDITFGNTTANAGGAVVVGGSSSSIEVIRFEIGEMKTKLTNGGAMVTAALATAIRQKINEKEAVARRLEEQLKSGDPTAKLRYLQSISKLPQEYNNEAKRLLGENKRDKAQIAMAKKKLVEREIDQLKDSRPKS